MNAKPSSNRTVPRPLQVFLCHASGDKPAVRELCKRLRTGGFQPWLDEEQLLPGQLWQQEIPKAVKRSDVVIVCLSRQSTTKTGYVQKEIAYALDAAEEQPEGQIFLIPLRLEQCEVPERLSPWQWVDLFAAQGYQKLVRALDARSQGAGESKPPIQPDESAGNARLIYRALVADLRNLDSAVHALGAVTGPSQFFLIPVQVQMLEVAAEPVCNARKSVSELGDTSTREELDKICKFVELIKVLSEKSQDGVGGAALAKVLEDLGAVKQLREKLLPRT